MVASTIPRAATPAGEGATSVKVSKGPKRKKAHICKVCAKSFSRQEHCTRHERSHTLERPFSCRYCGNRYARKDLVTRHEKSLHVDVYRPPGQPTASKSRHENTVEPSPVRHTKHPPQPDNEDVPRVEELMNVGTGTPLFPLSLGSSNPQNGAEYYDGHGGVHDNIPLDFSLPLTPMEMDLMDLSADLAHNPESQHSLSDEPLHGNEPTQFHLANKEGFQAEDHQKGSGFAALHAAENDRLSPPHDLDAMYNDLDFFGMMPNAGSNDYIRSPPSTESDSHHSTNYALQIPEHISFANGQDLHGSANANIDLSPIAKGGIKRSHLVLDDHIRQMLLRDLQGRLTQDQRRTLTLPSTSLLQRFLLGYQSCFHHHYPIIHLPSMDLERTPSPLILAICAIGALYRLDRKRAACLYKWADKAIHSMIETDSSIYSFSPWPTWVIQCKLLLAFASVFSGVPLSVRTSVESLEFFLLEYTFRRRMLENTRNSRQTLSWTDWVERETSKRLLGGIFGFANLVTITYNTTPRISMIPDAEIEMPGEEILWEATTAQQWKELTASWSPDQRFRVVDAVNHVLSGKPVEPRNAALGWSTFATTIVMHAINVHIWHIIQGSSVFYMAPLDTVSDQFMSTEAIRQAETALARCQNLFTDRGSEQEQTTLDGSGRSRRLNGLAILRVAYVRTSVGIKSLNPMVLFSTDSEEIAREIHTFIGSGQKRTALVTETAQKALEGLFTAVRAGKLLAMKTAAFKWSIDHAIADWDCALFVARWIHTLECQQQSHRIDFEERQILDNVIELLSDADSTFTRQTSLAAEVIRLWADLFDDTWVWGITPRMGAVMRAVATVCEKDRKARNALPYVNELLP